MTEFQIKEILKRLDAQDRKQVAQDEKLDAIMSKLDPMSKVFESVTGFNKVSVQILKALALLGAGIGVIYAFIKYLKT